MCFHPLHILPCTVIQSPTIRYLSELHVTKNWYALGLQLGISSQELDKFQRDYTRDEEMCKKKMFGAWLRSSSPTFWNLNKALIAIGRKDVAESISKREGAILQVVL